MRAGIRRFAFVGLLATVVDIGLFLVLEAAGLGVALADIIALSTAATFSYGLHRLVTLHNDPFTRWMHHVAMFVPVALAAGLVDIVVVVSLADRHTLGAKLVAVFLAAVIRVGAHRHLLFRRVRREQGEPAMRPTPAGAVRLSVVVPAYREAERIGDTIVRIREALAEVATDGGLEVVVVDDGSPDETSAAARSAAADLVVTLDENRGKGGAVRAGMLAASGRTVAFTDADLAYDPEQILGLLESVEQGWDVVVGNRRDTRTRTLVAARRLREIGGRVINVATQVLLLGQYRDTQCGLKAFRSDVADFLFSQTRIDGFAFDAEVFHLVERYSLTLTEVPVVVRNSERSTVKVVRDSYLVMRDLLRVRRFAREGRYALDLPEGLRAGDHAPIG